MYIFKSVEDAVKRIEKHSKSFNFPIKSNLNTPESIIITSVSQNIFRALGLDNHKPSKVYREWAASIFVKMRKELTECTNQNQYDKIVAKYTKSLLMNWENVTEQKMNYGPASKIFNLLIKAMQESKKYQIVDIFPFQHIPLDSYTLRPFHFIINEMTDLEYSISIPKTSSMSLITTPELYKIIQDAIFDLYGKLNKKVPPIHFDYFAWNTFH